MALNRNSVGIRGGYGGRAGFPGKTWDWGFSGAIWGLKRLLRKLPLEEWRPQPETKGRNQEGQTILKSVRT